MFSEQQAETRRWHRSVSQLGNRVREKALRQELDALYPEALYQFNLGVRGASDTTEIRVCLWRENPHIEVDGKAIPEDFGGDVRAAILQTLADLVEDFSRE
jgi:hypothetical protein